MRRRFLQGLWGLGVTALLASAVPLQGAAPAYHLITTIHVGGPGGWDYLAEDPVARRLYVSHSTHVVVIDMDRHEVVGDIPDTPGVHGFAVAPELGRGFTSNGAANTSTIVDLKTLKAIGTVKTGANPDGILYEPGRQQVYTFNGRGHSATVYDAKTGEVVATIALPGKPEFAVADPKAGRVYNNIEDKSEVVAIDTLTHKIVATWPIAPGEEASGMAADLANHRLFIGCDNRMMVMMDSTNGHVVATVPIGEGVDANRFDPGTHLAFSSNGEGTVTIAEESTPDTLKVVQTLKTQRSARTMALDTKTHEIYLSSADFEPLKAGQRRPTMVPGTFRVLVYGPGAGSR